MSNTDLARRLAGVSAEKRKLILDRVSRQATPNAMPPIERQPRAASGYPLSYAQQRLWFLDQMSPESIASVVPIVLQLEGEMDRAALDRAISWVVGRHEALRTKVAIRHGTPLQLAGDSDTFRPEYVDLTSLPIEKQQSEITKYTDQTLLDPFDLGKGSLFRAVLLRQSATRHTLILVMHHIVSDGVSLRILLDELAHCYEEFRTGNTSSLPELPIQYGDYSAWQRSMLETDGLRREMEYWRSQLQEEPPALNLLTDKPRPPIQQSKGATEHHSYSAELNESFRALANRQGVTQFMLLMAAMNVLFSRWSGQTDISLGTPVSNRENSALENVIGLFLNVLVLRSDLSADPSFEELLQQVKQTSIQASHNQRIPFERIVEQLKPTRDLSRQTYFQVLISMLPNVDLENRAIGNLTANFVPINSKLPTEYDITFYFRSDPFQVAAIYNPDLFEAPTIRRMLAHLGIILESVAADPQLHVSEIPLLPSLERQRVLEELNATDRDYPRTAAVHELFEQAVAERPEQVAVASGGRKITYAELNARANQLAAHLVELGVERDNLVAIYLDRSVEMAVALLGVLKAGAAYLPLDPIYPAERIAYMLADADCPIIVTHAHLSGELPESDARLVRIDTDWELIAEHSQDNLLVEVEPSQLAYTIYTSGSTGKPKGVQIPHGSAVNFLLSMAVEPGFTADDTMLAVTTLSFDISVLEMFLPLLAGGRLEIAEPDVAADPEQLMARLQSSGATMLQATPITWRMLLAADWQGDSHLKILCGGEAMPRDLADALLPRCASLWNMYGPTETTVWSSLHRVTADEKAVPIGHPIGNTRMYVLDARSEPTPIGVPGELYIGGEGLARGYRNRPELTAEKFVPDPFADVPNARMYHTGDLARWLDDGTLEFFGRIDHQVKIRGFRIELGEIESALEEHPKVRQAVVVAVDQRLVAYLVATSTESPPGDGDLRGWLKAMLPDYMVPTSYMLLDAFPQTPNGKVDRKRLPQPDAATRPELKTRLVAPRNEIEHQIAAAWCQVLKLDQVGIHDNFFDLGGYSLLLVQLQTELRKRCQRKISIVELFEHPTISSLGERIQQKEPIHVDVSQMETRAEKQKGALNQRLAAARRRVQVER